MTLRGWRRRAAMRAGMLAVLGCTAVVLGCGDPAAGGGAPSAPSGQEGWPAVVRVGLVPSEGGTDIVERFGPYIEHLRATLGVEVRAFSASEYVGIITAMQNDQVDIAYLGPKSYVEANRLAGATAVAAELNDEGTPGYHGIIVARRDSGMSTLADAKGRSFGFVTPNSTSGYLVPAIGIMEATGMAAEEYFSEVRYTGTHGTAVRAVLNGDIDTAATNSLDLMAMERNGLDASPLVELWRSDLIPGSVIAVRDTLPESFISAVRDATIGFNENRGALEQMARGGFVKATDADYDIVRLLEQRQEKLSDEGG
jgi:phosphonate transport system substrate-binding protein